MMRKNPFDQRSRTDGPVFHQIHIIRRTGSILVALFALLALSSECRAFYYRPAAALTILSEYAAHNDSAPPRTQIWTVVPEAGKDGAVTLRFFKGEAVGGEVVCTLTLPSSVSAGEIVWQGLGKSGEKRSGTGLLLLPGFPAPCDVLPAGGNDSGAVYKENVEAGGRIFSRSYRIDFNGFSIGEAKAMGWIKKEPAVSELTMVTATDERGRLAVRQLWPAGGSWWIYEETPTRRSWLIE
jgi:hypothetical protein